jgi:hypothetical protein
MKILQGVGNTEVEKHKQLFLSVWNGTSELFLSVWNGTSEWYIIEKPVSTPKNAHILVIVGSHISHFTFHRIITSKMKAALLPIS